MSNQRTYTLPLHENGEVFTVKVRATFFKGYPPTMEQPGESDTAEIHAVYLGDDEMVESLTDDQYFGLESLWLEAWYDEQAAHYDDID